MKEGANKSKRRERQADQRMRTQRYEDSNRWHISSHAALGARPEDTMNNIL